MIGNYCTRSAVKYTRVPITCAADSLVKLVLRSLRAKIAQGFILYSNQIPLIPGQLSHNARLFIDPQRVQHGF